MSISPETTADVLQQNMPLDVTERDMMIAAIRADRQQFGPLVQNVRRAVANDEYIALMVAAVKLAGAIEDGMVEK